MSSTALSLSQAAKAVGLHKTSVLRALKSGKISGIRDANGQWYVEPVELHRIFPLAAPATEPIDAMLREAPNIAELTARASLQRLSDLKAMLDEMRQEREAWKEQAQRLALPKPPEPEKPEPEKPEPQSWWRWLRSTG